MTLPDTYFESGVDIVFMGHYHTNEHQNFVYNGRTVPYIITGGGADLDGVYMWKAGEYVKHAIVFHFPDVKVNGDSMTVTAIDYTGKIIDKIELNSGGKLS